MQHNMKCFFHNLKFDGRFLLDWLLKNGYQHTTERGLQVGDFTTLISDMGTFYSIRVKWDNGHTTEFVDSLKKINMPVSAIAKAFQLGETKGDIEYTDYRAPGHALTDKELDYLKRDVLIVAKAMKEVLDSGMSKMTVASDCMHEYRTLTGDKMFNRLFPILSESMDAEIRRAYRGGWTYADPRFKSRLVGSGLVYDVNSLYPYIMRSRLLPYGEPEWADGKVEGTETHPLTIFSVTFTARIKADHVPCIQIKKSMLFGSVDYLSIIDEPVTLMVSNVDWALYNDHYDIDILAYGGGWRFHATYGMFDDYVDKWAEIKAASTGGRKEIAKSHLNNLYGKFATNPQVSSKIPVLDGDIVRLVTGMDETRPPVYTAVGVFTTAYARDMTIRAAQQNYSVFAYADTDSLHLLQDEEPDSLEVHPTKLGAWKLEYAFDAAFYIRPKGYMERAISDHCVHEPDELDKHGDWCRYVTKIAGLPIRVTSRMMFDDLVDGKEMVGKLKPKTVAGGVVLLPEPFTIKL